MTPVQLQNLLQQGIIHHRAGRLADALAIYTRVRSVAPRNFDAVHLTGVVALQQGRPGDAIEMLARALQLNSRSAVCRMRLGLALMSDGRSREAEPHFRAAVEIQPDFAEGWDNLAYCLKAQDRLKEAVECHLRSTSLNPRNAVGWYNYGLTLSLCGRIADALQCHERALAVDPHYSKALYGRAQVLQQGHRVHEAVAAYDAYLEKEPRHWEAHSYRLFALNYLEELPRERLFEEHVAFGRALEQVAPPEFPNEPEPDRRLRVAILSPDLRSHSCAYFLEPLLEHLDSQQFEVYLYHDHFREDVTSRRLQARSAVWRNFVGRPLPVVESAIRADAPDILIDLAGHTGMTNRLPLFARHAAPVQITYLGYPNTTGVPAIGYRFTDAVADPPLDADALATEKLVRFAPTAWAYRPPERAPDVAPAPCLADHDAPITFGSFNNLAKVNDLTLRLWSRILERVPNSRLKLKGRGLTEPAVRARYAERFTACGLPLHRIDLVEHAPETLGHLGMYAGLDVALDTFPYHGTTTTCEALWMGVPVVTLAGDRHVSRVSASLLSAIGRQAWVASTSEDYVRLAAGLAADRAQLGAIRAGLRDEMRRSALLDHEGQSARFAAALRSCWQTWCESRRCAATAI